MTLCYIDTETTGLDDRIHQPYEVCYWLDDAPDPVTLALPHTLEHADLRALDIGGYFDRVISGSTTPHDLAHALRGVTFVGSNPGFDARMLRRFIGTEVWSHRMIDVAQAGMWLFGWDRPKGLGDLSAHLRDMGYDIPQPDHTAEGDVRATRAVHIALRDIAQGAA